VNDHIGEALAYIDLEAHLLERHYMLLVLCHQLEASIRFNPSLSTSALIRILFEINRVINKDHLARTKAIWFHQVVLLFHYLGL